MSGPLTRKAAHGVTWYGLAQVLNKGSRFISTIVLARLLFPEDFGIVAMAAIFAELVLHAGDIGFSVAIIQRKNTTDSHLSTAFWSGLALGIIFCVVTVAISPFVADFFGNEQVGPILSVYSIVFVIAPLRSVHGALLNKRLQFFTFSVAEVGAGIAYMVAAISLAFAGFGVWSLVLGNIASELALAILRWILCRWHPSFTFSLNSLKDLWQFGSNLTLSRVIVFLIDRLDYLIIGRFLTTAALGFYSMGTRVVNMPRSWLSMTMLSVAFPTFSTIQDENERLRRGFVRTINYLSLIILPLFVVLAIVAPEFVTVVLGQKWTETILPLQILCVMATCASIGAATTPLIRSKGRPDIEMKLNLLKLVLLAPCLLIAVRFGTVGVAMGLSAVAFILWPIQQILANRLIGLSMMKYLTALRPAVFGSAAMAMVLLAFRYASASLLTLPDIGLLVSSLVIGAVIYLLTLKIARTEALNEMIELVREIVSTYTRPVMMKIPLFKKEVLHVADEK